MSRCEMTLVANAGLLLRLERCRILLDALHDRQVESWSTVTEERWQTLQALLPGAGPDLILFTHCHPDHFSPKLTARAMERWPGARLVLPEQRLAGQRLVDGARETVTLPGVTVRLARLPHEGENFARVRHYGCLVESGDFRVLDVGDCKLCDEALAEFAAEHGPVDVLAAPFPWLTLRRGREFILDRIRPGHVVINHLPFAGEDMYGYRTGTFKAAAAWQGPELTVLSEPFQTISFD